MYDLSSVGVVAVIDGVFLEEQSAAVCEVEL